MRNKIQFKDKKMLRFTQWLIRRHDGQTNAKEVAQKDPVLTGDSASGSSNILNNQEFSIGANSGNKSRFPMK